MKINIFPPKKKSFLIYDASHSSLLKKFFKSKNEIGILYTRLEEINLYILLKRYLTDKNYNLEKKIYNSINNLKYINKIEIAKIGFINIFFDETFLIEKFNQIISYSENYGNNNSGNNKKINIEFISANPTGPIHVGHMRGAVIGDVLASILETTGHSITREYYVNDAGSQILILGNSLFKRYQQIFNIKVNKMDTYEKNNIIFNDGTRD